MKYFTNKPTQCNTLLFHRIHQSLSESQSNLHKNANSETQKHMFWRLCIFHRHSTREPALIKSRWTGWPMLFCGPTWEPVLAAANTGKAQERFWKNASEWTRKVEINREKIPGSRLTCMAIYLPARGLKGRTFELWVLNRWDLNFCVFFSQLRGIWHCRVTDKTLTSPSDSVMCLIGIYHTLFSNRCKTLSDGEAKVCLLPQQQYVLFPLSNLLLHLNQLLEPISSDLLTNLCLLDLVHPQWIAMYIVPLCVHVCVCMCVCV